MAAPAGEEKRAPMLLRNAESAMTGTVVCAAVIAASAGHTESIRSLEITIIVTVGGYWLVHLYAITLAMIISNRHRPWLALRLAAEHSWLSAGASLVPVAVLVVADRLGATIISSAFVALAVTVGLLAVYGAIAGHRAGFGRFGIGLSAAFGAGFGLLLVVIKVAVH